MQKFQMIIFFFLFLTAAIKPSFLSIQISSDINGDGNVSFDELDPPGGHGLPQFSRPIEDLSSSQIEKEINDWKMAEAAAEDEFFSQTNSAIAEVLSQMKNCESITDLIAKDQCLKSSKKNLDLVNDMIADLQTEHAIEEEYFEAAMKEIIYEKRRQENLGRFM